MLCKYKNLFGEVGKGIHSYRLFNISTVDVLLTILGAYFLSFFLKYKFIYILLTLFLLGIILHRIFCVETTIDKILFS